MRYVDSKLRLRRFVNEMVIKWMFYNFGNEELENEKVEKFIFI